MTTEIFSETGSHHTRANLDALLSIDSAGALPERVLVVDDEPAVARFVVRVLQRAGVETATAATDRELYAAFDEFFPEVVILDLNMPGLDGVEVLRWIASHHSGVGVILMSGVDRRVLESVTRLGETLGVRIIGRQSKPMNPESLLSLLRQSSPQSGGPSSEIPGQISLAELEESLARGYVTTFLQPIFDLRSLEMVAAEALARLVHPKLGLVSPLRFIPLAEESGLIRDLTFHVASDALSRCAEWLSENSERRIHLNVSPVMLNDLELPDFFHDFVTQRGVDPSQVVIELTETGPVSDRARMLDVLTRFRLKSFHLAQDDYGAGAATMGNLHELPFDEAKIDRAFGMSIMKDPESASIVRSTVALARELGLRVVCEGIEDGETMRWLGAIGCHYGQGYYLGEPMTIEDFLKMTADVDALDRHRMYGT